MANWAGAVETFGKGLFEVGKVVVRREDDEIAFMRQKALQELGIKAQKELQAANQEFTKGENERNREHDTTMATTRVGAELAMQDRGNAQALARLEVEKKWDAERDAAMRNFTLKTRESDSIQDIIRSTNAQLGDIAKSIDSWEQELFAAQSEGVADPAAIERYQRRIESLYAQQDQVRQAGQAAVSRLTGGKPVQPGPTKEAAAELTAGKPAPAAPAAAPKGPPPGAYTGGSTAAPAAAPPSAQTGSLFELSPEKTPWAFKSTGDINRSIGGKLAGAVVDESPTGQINRKIYESLFGN